MRRLGLLAVLLSVLLVVPLAFSQRATAQDASSAHGKYLVALAGCGDCHGEKLQGGPLFFQPAKDVKLPGPWASKAPKIAGFPMFKTDAQAVTFLKTGVMPDGSHPGFRCPTSGSTTPTQRRSSHT